VSETPAAALRPAPPLRLVSRTGPPLGLIFGATGALTTIAVGVLHLDRLPMALCYVKVLTGLPCPSCGSTRALGRLFALDVPGAFAMNPLATFGALVLAAWAAADLALLPRRRALGVEVAPPLGSALRVAAVAAVLANWAYLVAAGR
jgi:hypothetical protein